MTMCRVLLHLEFWLSASLLTGCVSPREKSALFDEGYWRGASDAVKRHYWLKQAAERERGPRSLQTYTYEYPLPQRTDDGRQLVPETATVEVEQY